VTPEQIVKDYLQFANTQQWHRLAELFHEDATYRTPGPRPRQGQEGVVSFYPKASSARLVHQETAGELIVERDSVAAKIVFTGNTLHCKAVTFECVDNSRLRDGKIATLSTGYELAPVRKAMQ